MYEQLYQQSISDPDGFWAAAAEAVHWYKKWDRVLDNANPPFYRWFSGGLVNSCYNALDWHVANG
ncbi:MAG TPA: acetyl-coenzyme A synthetase N-terminal domain-containing protein, partial [Chloroflexota bacterium]|nr:acetyl-coenzyme A synthetase N-terminal domain-containing protein [Chloroflexota bacterium]